jgi:CelD/BcsL family acetyltransferase involved in cellulose biosynthesis
LFDADPDATPFSSPGWAQAWWPLWAGTARPWVVAVRDGPKLVGLAPLVVRRRGPFRVLTELGKEPGNYWDILAAPEHREAVASAVVAEIDGRSREWDALVLRALPEDSAIERALGDRGLRLDRRPPDAYPGIELPSSFDEYLKTLTSKRRKDLRRHLRRLDEGSLSCEEVRDPEELEAAIGRWQELRVRWWGERGRRIDPEHASDRFRAFLVDLVQLLVPEGLAVVWRFRDQDETVGVEISLVDSSTFYAWLDGYDPDAAHLGLGKVAIGEGIRSSIAAGRSYFDFMVGAEGYKYWYGASDRHRRWLMASSGRGRSRLARGAGALAGAVRRTRGDASVGDG